MFVESIGRKDELDTQIKGKRCNYHLEPGCGISRLLSLSLLEATV